MMIFHYLSPDWKLRELDENAIIFESLVGGGDSLLMPKQIAGKTGIQSNHMPRGKTKGAIPLSGFY